MDHSKSTISKTVVLIPRTEDLKEMENHQKAAQRTVASGQVSFAEKAQRKVVKRG